MFRSFYEDLLDRGNVIFQPQGNLSFYEYDEDGNIIEDEDDSMPSLVRAVVTCYKDKEYDDVSAGEDPHKKFVSVDIVNTATCNIEVSKETANEYSDGYLIPDYKTAISFKVDCDKYRFIKDGNLLILELWENGLYTKYSDIIVLDVFRVEKEPVLGVTCACRDITYKKYIKGIIKT